MDDRKHAGSETKQVYRKKRRSFSGNQFTSDKNTEKTSTAAKKIKSSDPDFTPTVHVEAIYSFIHWTLFLTLQQSIICKNCKKDVKFSKTNIKGVGFDLVVICDCEERVQIPSSPKIHAGFEINRRLIYVLRLLGVGFNGFLNFCGLMDISHSAISLSGYYDAINHIHIAVSAVAETVFKKAAKEEQEKNREKGLPEDRLSVSGDGSWPKRGFAALLGIVSLIGKFSNKIIDVIVKSKICQACRSCKFEKNTPEHDAWYSNHVEKGECHADHEGSSGLMEVEGVIEMFSRSMERFKVMYEFYIGDGDSKCFKRLEENKPYGDECIVKKKECVLHVKKRLYRRGKQAKQEFAKKNKVLKQAAKKAAEEQAAAAEAAAGPSKKKRKLQKKKYHTCCKALATD